MREQTGFRRFGVRLNNGWNAFIGEYGSFDSDQLWLHGKKGIIVTNYTASEYVAQLGIGDDSRCIFSTNIYAPNINIIAPVEAGMRSAPNRISNALSRLLQLNSISYEYTEPEGRRSTGLDGEHQTGTVAYPTNEKERADEEMMRRVEVYRQTEQSHFGIALDELETLFPSLVETSTYGVKSINYLEMIPVLVAALQEQQNTIQYLTVSLQEYQRTCCGSQDTTREENDNPKRNHVSGNHDNSHPLGEEYVLCQNTPNPFSTTTTIEYNIKKKVSDAILYIFDLSGMLIQTLPLTTGHGTISVKASSLKAGMYIYTLVIDGKIIDSKQMLLTN